MSWTTTVQQGHHELSTGFPCKSQGVQRGARANRTREKCCLLHFRVPGTSDGPSQHHHLDVVAKASTPLTLNIISRYTTFFTISREYLSLFGSSVTVAAATVNTPLLALHCLYSMRPVVYIRSILLSAPQIVGQALTFDFRPSGCELVDCHSDGHKAFQSFLRTECDCVNQLTYSCCCCCSREEIRAVRSGLHSLRHDHHAVALEKRLEDTRSIPHLLQHGDRTTVREALQMSLDC